MTNVTKWDKEKVFVIAEIGGNHEGNFEYAQRLLRLAAESKADAVKFQVYTGDSLVSPVEDPARHTHFEKFALSTDKYLALAKEAAQLGIMFMASVWDIDQIDICDPYMPIYKIGSGDLTAYPIIKKTISKGKPTILSTGMSTLEEVLEVVQFIRECDAHFVDSGKLALLQCTSMYPIPDSDANLNSMKLLADKTGLPVGYSDHTVGDYAVQIAVAMGACIIEEHFTDTRENKTFRDHQVSMTKEEMQNFVQRIQQIKLLQGAYGKQVMPSEAHHRHSFRRAVYLKQDLSVGSILTESDLVTLRPNVGISAHEFYRVVGKRLKTDKRAFERLERSELT